MGAVLDEHDERFHQDISKIVKKYSGKWSPHVLVDCCWSRYERNQLVKIRGRRR
jgi:hypothetical protein